MNSHDVKSLLFRLYISLNIACFFYFLYSGFLGGDFSQGQYKADIYTLTISIFIVVAIFVLNLKFIYPLFEKYKFINVKLRVIDDFYFHLLFFLLSVFFLYCAYLGISNSRVDHDSLDVSKMLFYSYSLLSPQYLILIYAYYMIHTSSKLYIINVSLLVVSYYISGSTFILIYLFPILIFQFKVRGINLRFKTAIGMIIIGIFLYPFFRILKYAINSMFNISSSFDFNEINLYLASVTDGGGLFDLYIKFLIISIERFQIVANVDFILNNTQDLIKTASNFDYSNINFYIFRNIESILFNYESSSLSLQNILAYKISGNTDWASHISLLGPFIFEGIYSLPLYLVIYFFLYICISISSCIGGGVSTLTWCNLLILIVHGWFSPFTYYLYSLIVFLIVIAFFNLFNTRKF